MPSPMTAQEEEESMSVRSDGPITRSRAKAIARATSSLIMRAGLQFTQHVEPYLTMFTLATICEAPDTVLTGHP